MEVERPAVALLLRVRLHATLSAAWNNFLLRGRPTLKVNGTRMIQTGMQKAEVVEVAPEIKTGNYVLPWPNWKRCRCERFGYGVERWNTTKRNQISHPHPFAIWTLHFMIFGSFWSLWSSFWYDKQILILILNGWRLAGVGNYMRINISVLVPCTVHVCLLMDIFGPSSPFSLKSL